MFRSVFTIFARHHDFTPAELSGAEQKLPKGWTLDRRACSCAPEPAGGWQAELVLVDRTKRTVRIESAVQADPTQARREAMDKLLGAARDPLAHDGFAGRQTSLAAESPAPAGLRPSAILSLREPARSGGR